MEDKRKIELDIADAILDRPKGFSVGHRHFFLWPVTLGKMYLTQRLVEQLEIDYKLLQKNPFIEALRLIKEKRDDCIQLLTYHTLKTKEEVNNTRKVTIRKNILSKEIEDSDLATLLIICLTWDKTASFIKHTHLDKEMERMQTVAKCKKDNNTYQFGGVTTYGSIIDQACERYGWTFDYVVWEISYINLQMMLKDSIKSIFLTDEEAKRCHVAQNGNVDGNDAGAMATVIAEGNWG